MTMRAACAQLDAKSMINAAEVWPVVLKMAHQAAAAKADLLVYPEVTYPSYWLESRERYLCSDIERTPAVLDRFSKVAARHSMWVVAGIVEEAGERLYNSAAVFNRAGNVVARARKQFMWDCDRSWFTPGTECTVLDTEFGKWGLLVCADLRLPEISATLAARGAQVVIQPTAWVNASPVRRTYRNIQPDFLVAARAIEFGMPFVCCSKSGREGAAMEYVGQSRIVSASGKTLVTAEIGGDELVAADLTLGAPVNRPMEPPLRERLTGLQPPYTAEPTHLKCGVHLNEDGDALAHRLQRQGVRIARMTYSQIQSFAAARCAALDGVQVIVVSESALPDDLMPRVRAAENRVFVLVMSAGRARLVVDPAGTILWRRADAVEAMELDIGQADRKFFTPTTDIWSQRNVNAYQFD